jgi:tRNA(Arg) A34 adenosine deaminase TadA
MSKKQSLKAIIYDKKGRVLSIGQNSYTKTHPLQAYHAYKEGMPERIYLHAEIDAIVKCPDITKASKILVIRKDTYGKPMNAQPCKVCMSALKTLNLKEIKWTT